MRPKPRSSNPTSRRVKRQFSRPMRRMSERPKLRRVAWKAPSCAKRMTVPGGRINACTAAGSSARPGEAALLCVVLVIRERLSRRGGLDEGIVAGDHPAFGNLAQDRTLLAAKL